MKQFTPPIDSIVDAPLTGVAAALRPVVFKEGNGYCCLLGPDPQTGVMGCGDTPEAAIADWDARLRVHLANAGDDDVIVKHVQDFMGVKPSVSPSEQDLLDKYGLHPVDRSKTRG